MPIRQLAALITFAAILSAAEPAYEHGVSFFGSFKYPPDLAHFDYVNPHAPKGGTLVRASQTNWNSFTPLLGKGIPTPGISVIHESILYDGLLMSSDDELGTYYGNLAEAVMVPEDFTWARFRLRPEAHFHDGVPVTTRDVAFTFDHIRDNSWAGVRAAFSMVASTEIHNAREVTFHFHDTGGLNAGVVISLGKVPILPEHYWRDRDITQTTLTPPPGNGPYRVARAEQARFLRYERVPDYWGRRLGIHRGRHNFDQIRYDYYRDATVAREALRKGLVDFRIESDPRYWKHGYDIPARHKGWIVMNRQNFAMYVGILRGLAINTRREKLSDLRVREALTLAYDFDWFNRVLNDHFNARTESYFPHSRFAATGLPSRAELALLEPYRATLPERVFTDAFELPRGNGFGRNREALLRARQLLGEAGWNVRDGLLRNAAGEALRAEPARPFRRGGAAADALRRPAAPARLPADDPHGGDDAVRQPDERIRLRHQRARLRYGATADGGGDLVFPLRLGRQAPHGESTRHRPAGRGRPGDARTERPDPRGTHRRAAGSRPRSPVALLHDPAHRRGRTPRRLLGQVRHAALRRRVPHELSRRVVV